MQGVVMGEVGRLFQRMSTKAPTQTLKNFERVISYAWSHWRSKGELVSVNLFSHLHFRSEQISCHVYSTWEALLFLWKTDREKRSQSCAMLDNCLACSHYLGFIEFSINALLSCPSFANGFVAEHFRLLPLLRIHHGVKSWLCCAKEIPQAGITALAYSHTVFDWFKKSIFPTYAYIGSRPEALSVLLSLFRHSAKSLNAQDERLTTSP